MVLQTLFFKLILEFSIIYTSSIDEYTYGTKSLVFLELNINLVLMQRN